MSYTVRQLAALLGLDCQGDDTRPVASVSGLEHADEGSLVFWEGNRDAALPAGILRAACVITSREKAESGMTVLFSGRPKIDFTRAAALLHPPRESSGARHPAAVVSPEALIGECVELGPGVVVEAGAHIGAGSILAAGVTVGRGCILGERCVLHPRVVLYPEARLGNGVILHAGVVIGSDGFGYVFDGDRRRKFPQVGLVIIEDDVEIGANTTVDRGSLGTTRIGAGAKIDNLVQIAHNVEIGKHVVIAAQTGISGSTVIEDHAVIGGQVGFGDHARVQQGVVIGSKAGVLPGKIVRSGETYWGVPVRPLREYKRLNALFGRLPEMKAEIDALKKEMAELRAVLGKSGTG
ncbi:MAG TPA: UDP-3-O-(3-hydroxymyristoyl)glucosamine N-acyltransferase [Acidobacteriota bacterium]|nr:UDP-3-O-(3-hydroxymyristoyl)glucosamine N-acyltransferase [Acidobacteriota bacterium]